MRIALATVTTPPIRGGAEILADGLAVALAEAGHAVHRIVTPFGFDPGAVEDSMRLWSQIDFERFSGGSVDRVVCLKFPTWLMRHPSRIAWMLHQHRPAYELFGTPYGLSDDPVGRRVKDAVTACDETALSELDGIFTISARVSERLKSATGFASRPLYHPPADEALFGVAAYEPFILVPSRLEALKRQDLFLEALAACRSPLVAAIVGDGGMRRSYEALAEKLGLANRVRFLGSISRRALINLYARCACVYFGPLDEDYGYVTLEAMLSAKPVVTLTDSGGALEFVVDGETGRIVVPAAEAIAEALEGIVASNATARALGEGGAARYRALGIDWATVATALVETREGSACA